MNLNKIFLIGNLTSDPETRNTPSGDTVCTFRMATNRIWNDRKTGERQQRTEYHTVVTWRKLADVASQYLAKGRMVFIEGRIQTRSWEDSSNNKHYKTEIIAQNLQLGPRPAGSNQPSAPTSKTAKKTGSNKKEQKENNKQTAEDIPTIEEGYDGKIDVNDIPF